ncbi:Fur family transcriptional regulator [Candidatus Spyradosoma sp. SGI.093]|uniref:Fur family transcriptional regulator n=1 Tax=Candidatus Spyradosoma sp. SGI.093 TaxID=3420583 RepID=UPI003D01982C
MKKSAPKVNFTEMLASVGLRNTAPRLAIWDAAYHYDGHFTAEDLLNAARRKHKKISRATVYRALPDLVRSGVLSELDIGRDFKYYESTRNAGTFKGHIVCSNCEKIIEFDAPFMDWYGRAIAEKNGLVFLSQHLQITAQCPNCSCRNHKPKRGKSAPAADAPCRKRAKK